MALPWLIGGLALYAAKKLADNILDDDDSSSYDHEGASRRREEAERERAKTERKKKLEAARENFAVRGEAIGLDIAQSLKGWIRVKSENSPTFQANLNSRGYKIEQELNIDQNINDLLPSKNHQFQKIRENLKIYSDIYNVKLTKDIKMSKFVNEIEAIDHDLKQLEMLKNQIAKLKSEIAS